MRLEDELHGRFRRERGEGEWFDASESLLAYIREYALPWPGHARDRVSSTTRPSKFTHRANISPATRPTCYTHCDNCGEPFPTDETLFVYASYDDRGERVICGGEHCASAFTDPDVPGRVACLVTVEML